jgi:hypothetical protein
MADERRGLDADTLAASRERLRSLEERVGALGRHL